MSFWSRIESWFGKHMGGYQWAQTAEVALNLVGPPAILVVQSTLGSADAAEGQAVMNEVKTDLATIVQLLDQAKTGDTSANGKITALLTSLQANLQNILKDAHVKDSANSQKITQMVTAFSEEITAVLAMIPAANSPQGQ